MPDELFVDTSAWYPLVVRSHPQHTAIARALRRLVNRGTRVVTSNLVVAETHALLLRRVHRSTALEFVRTVREPPNLIVPSSPDLETAAVSDWLEAYEDQDLSFADAVSFAIMSERGIADALTLDRHFATAGFRMLPARATR